MFGTVFPELYFSKLYFSKLYLRVYLYCIPSKSSHKLFLCGSWANWLLCKIFPGQILIFCSVPLTRSTLLTMLISYWESFLLFHSSHSWYEHNPNSIRKMIKINHSYINSLLVSRYLNISEYHEWCHKKLYNLMSYEYVHESSHTRKAFNLFNIWFWK